jgi:DNA polymerase-1
VKPQEATLDLFSAINSDTTPLPLQRVAEEERRAVEDPQESLEGRLVSYLLNPEVAYNPSQPIQWETLKADSALWNLYQEVELPLSSILREMEQAGVRLDVGMLKQAEVQLDEELQVLEQQIYASAETTFNINSPKQVGEVLFDQLKLDAKAKKSKTGQYSTSEEVLLALKPKHPVVGMILAYRELKKLISTYISALPTYINPETGKIHTTYNQTVTATGRLSSSNPNLQNLPIRSERGQLIRQAVIPDEDCMFLSADYSQIELRLMAHFSQDPHLVEAFRSGQDIHAATAAKIFNVPIEEVTKDQRRQAKTANFGIIYGISAFGLAQQLDCSRSEAKALIDGYFAAFPGVIDYIERQKELARQQGYAITLFGRKRYLPDILSHNATVRSFAERNAVNSPIQGTAADIIKMAMVTIHRRLKEEGLKAQMIMQVHDELNFNVPLDEVEQVREIVVSEMQNVVHLTVPLIADCGVGKNWLDAH